MRAATDMTGERCGRLLVIERAKTAPGIAYWVCRCDCGNVVTACGSILRRGNKKSCGCISPRINHGDSGSAEYEIWKAMRGRCNNQNQKDYKYYGGRGISVCARWDNYELFLADMDRRPTDDHSIERENNDGNYEPDNCVWATQDTQLKNTRRSRRLTLDGKAATINDLAGATGLSYSRAAERVRAGEHPDSIIRKRARS